MSLPRRVQDYMAWVRCASIIFHQAVAIFNSRLKTLQDWPPWLGFWKLNLVAEEDFFTASQAKARGGTRTGHKRKRLWTVRVHQFKKDECRCKRMLRAFKIFREIDVDPNGIQWIIHFLDPCGGPVRRLQDSKPSCGVTHAPEVPVICYRGDGSRDRNDPTQTSNLCSWLIGGAPAIIWTSPATRIFFQLIYSQMNCIIENAYIIKWTFPFHLYIPKWIA